MRRTLKITTAALTLALGFTVAAIAGTARPAAAATCIQWDAYVIYVASNTATADTSDADTIVLDGVAVDDLPLDYQMALGPLPDPEPNIICLIVKPKLYISHG